MILRGFDTWDSAPTEIPLSSIASVRHVDGETEVRLLNDSLIRLKGVVHLPEPIQKDDPNGQS